MIAQHVAAINAGNGVASSLHSWKTWIWLVRFWPICACIYWIIWKREGVNIKCQLWIRDELLTGQMSMPI